MASWSETRPFLSVSLGVIHCAASAFAGGLIESNSWRLMAINAGYLFALAYLASFVTYQVAVLLGAG